MSDFADLLAIIGRKPEEPCTILTQKPGATGLEVEWTTVAEAPAVAEKHSGLANVWYGVQPIRQSVGRGKSNDIVGLRTLYADLDDKNMTREQAMRVIGHLSETLGVGTRAIVVSGGGVQPVWPIEEMDPISGADLLLWWREQVIRCAKLEGVSVDTGVYDLARILRVPGPPNMKPAYGPGGARTGLIRAGAGWTISHAELGEALARAPKPEGRSRGSLASGGFKERLASGEDRVFTPEQFQRYLEVDPGKVKKARETPHGAGFNTALNEACFDIAAGVPEIISEEEAWEIAYSIVEAQFPGGPDGNDIATIRSGFSQSRWSARRPTEAEASNPFSVHADVEVIKKKQGGIRAASPRSLSVTSRQSALAAADSAAAAAMEGLGRLGVAPDVVTADAGMSATDERWEERKAAQQARGYFLPDEFWNALPVLGHVRKAARAARVSPEGVLVAAMAEVALRIMPNVKIPAYVKTPASLSFGVIIVGGSGTNKSSSVDLAQELFEFEGCSPAQHYFGVQSAQGIAGQYQHFEKPRAQPGFMQRDRWAAMNDEDEGDKLAALVEKDLMLVATIRSALMGKLIGAGNVGDTKTNLPKHSYRFVQRICTLPSHCRWILSDDVGGLPQRLIWACVEDSRIEPEEAPGRWRLTLPAEFLLDPVSGGLRPEFFLVADEAVKAEILAEDELRAKLGVGKLDEHSLLTKEKVAWIIAAMQGGSEIRHDVEWRLAEMVMTMSNASRAYAASEVSRAAAEAAQAQALGKGKSRVIEESVVKAHEEMDGKGRVTRNVLTYLTRAGAEGMTKGELRDKLRSTDKHLLDEGALDGLLETGQARFEDIVKNDRQVGSRWFLTGL